MRWKTDLRTSISVHERLVLPVLLEMVKGEYIRVEGSEEEIAQLLDQSIGIDGMIRYNGIFYGVGSRIQIDSGVWNTFTIRSERESGHITEFEKLCKAVKNDAMRPHMTVQAYVENDCLKSIAVAYTRDIIHFIKTHTVKVKESHDCNGYAEFIVVPWQAMIDAGYKVEWREFK